ncbi:hypothetical protein B194_1130 [Serratia plymuthica A30]|nr:hypothetical protein B194_1130 [Serratia plymuthica A30]
MKKSEGLQAIEKPLASLPHAIGKHIPELSEANILSTFEQLHHSRADVFERGIIMGLQNELALPVRQKDYCK